MKKPIEKRAIDWRRLRGACKWKYERQYCSHSRRPKQYPPCSKQPVPTPCGIDRCPVWKSLPVVSSGVSYKIRDKIKELINNWEPRESGHHGALWYMCQELRLAIGHPGCNCDECNYGTAPCTDGGGPKPPPSDPCCDNCDCGDECGNSIIGGLTCAEQDEEKGDDNADG